MLNTVSENYAAQRVAALDAQIAQLEAQIEDLKAKRDRYDSAEKVSVDWDASAPSAPVKAGRATKADKADDKTVQTV